MHPGSLDVALGSQRSSAFRPRSVLHLDKRILDDLVDGPYDR